MIMLVMFHSPTDFNLNCVPQKLRDKAEKSTALSYFSYDGFEVFTEGNVEQETGPRTPRGDA